MSASNNIRKWYPVAGPEEIPLREGRKAIWKNYEAAIFNLGDEFLAVENQCPHKKGPLADGLVSGKSVFCPLHNLKIGLEHGCAINGGTGQVKIFPVKVINGRVCVAFEEGAYGKLPDCET